MQSIDIIFDRPFVRKRCGTCVGESSHGSECCNGRGWVLVQWHDQHRVSQRLARRTHDSRRIPLNFGWKQGKPDFTHTEWAWCRVLGVCKIHPGACFGCLLFGGIDIDQRAAIKQALDERDKMLFNEGPFPDRKIGNLPSREKLQRYMDQLQQAAQQYAARESVLEMPTGFDWES